MFKNKKPYILNQEMTAIEVYQALQEHISKANSFAQTGVLDYVMETIGEDMSDFLWVLMDLLTQIKELYDKLPVPMIENDEAA